jgi:hypothetical protein
LKNCLIQTGRIDEPTDEKNIMKTLINIFNIFVFLLFFSTNSISYDSKGKIVFQQSFGPSNDKNYHYSFWKECGDVHIVLNKKGKYSSEWNDVECNWVGGKGWYGNDKITNIESVEYQAKFNIKKDKGVYFGIYGWTTDPLIEYYIIESHGSHNPLNCKDGKNFGKYKSNEEIYEVVKCRRENKPAIGGGLNSFDQYFSVRSPKKELKDIDGIIKIKDHFNYWESKGLKLGKHYYMILATESWDGVGTSEVEIKNIKMTHN